MKQLYQTEGSGIQLTANLPGQQHPFLEGTVEAEDRVGNKIIFNYKDILDLANFVSGFLNTVNNVLTKIRAAERTKEDEQKAQAEAEAKAKEEAAKPKEEVKNETSI